MIENAGTVAATARKIKRRFAGVGATNHPNRQSGNIRDTLQKIAESAVLLWMSRTQIVRRAAGAASKQRPPAANFRRAVHGPPICLGNANHRRAAIWRKNAPPLHPRSGRSLGTANRQLTRLYKRDMASAWRRALRRQRTAKGASLAIAPELCHMSFALPPRPRKHGDVAERLKATVC